MTFITICQFSKILGELEITPLPNAYCLMEVANKTNSQSTFTVYGNLSLSCDLYIKPLSSSQILISVVASNITSTDYMYVERMGHLDVCSNRYVAFMELMQQPCKANFGSAAIQLHFRGGITVGIQDVMVEDRPLGCPEDVNQELLGALEGQTSNCKQVKGFGSVVQCVGTNHQWWVLTDGRLESGSKPTSRCDVQCPNNCSCMLPDRQVVYNCSQSIQELGKTSSRFLLFPSNISHLDLSKNGISALTMKTFMSIGKDIRYLDLSSNFLTTLPSCSLDYLFNIINLNFDRNSLATLDTELFINLHNLTFLFLYSSALVKLDVDVFANLHILNALYLYDNALVTLDAGVFANLHNLAYLNLLNDSLVRLDAGVFANLYNLISLELDHNVLVELEMHVFVNLHKLNRLFLIDNKLVALNYRTFHELVELRYLYINNNKINHFQDGTFINLFCLEVLSVASNRLNFLPLDIFEDLHSLVQLDLSGNRLQTIPQIGHMPLLNEVNLFGNPLAEITKNMCSRVGNTVSIFVDQPEVWFCYMNGSDTCFNTIKPSPYLTCDQLLPLTVLTMFIWIIGCSAIFGNVFVVWWK